MIKVVVIAIYLIGVVFVYRTLKKSFEDDGTEFDGIARAFVLVLASFSWVGFAFLFLITELGGGSKKS